MLNTVSVVDETASVTPPEPPAKKVPGQKKLSASMLHFDNLISLNFWVSLCHWSITF